ncbi:unnamed protein product [Diamesa serratosioi]
MHQNNDESMYEDLINETNMLSNTLLAEIIKEKIDKNKKKFISNMKTQLIQMSAHLQDYCNSYKKLRSLNISYVHEGIGAIDNIELEDHVILLEKIVQDLNQIFSIHIQSDASQLITKDEITFLQKNIEIIALTKDQLQISSRNTDTANMTDQLKEIEGVKRMLVKTFNDLKSSQQKIEHLQQSVIENVSAKISADGLNESLN